MVRNLLRRRVARCAMACMLPLFSLGISVAPASATAESSPGNGCHLQSADSHIKHVVSITFDNTHFTRDRPNVPSDLEFMPNLLNFMKDNGTLLTNYHTPLISHTATDILTSLTGVYGDRHGQPTSNSWRYYLPNGKTSTGVSFAYWTSPVYDPTAAAGTNNTYTMLTPDGKNAPAPWVPFTRAGCNFGGVSTANVVLENSGIDVPTVFGKDSAEAAEAKDNPNLAFANYVGIAVHCATSSTSCSAANKGKPDLLPDEPGGYAGFNGLFGHRYVAPRISPSGPLTDLNGNEIKNVRSGTAGFPGFDSMPAAVSLAYVAAMQEHGIPVTYAYITDSHDLKARDGQVRALGPGEAGYVANLKANDDAFGKFFTRLAADGIDKSNTLFIFNADEGDHFAGGTPNPENCNGVAVFCTWPAGEIGQVGVNANGLLNTQQGLTTPFDIRADVAPSFYLIGNPAQTAPVTRNFERAVGKLHATNPYTGRHEEISEALADQVGMKLLHLIAAADPSRNGTFTQFALPDYRLFKDAPNCQQQCVAVDPRFAWQHGTFTPVITTTWLGVVGPGVRVQGERSHVWSDHADLRPTILSLLGLQDSYPHQGRVLFEELEDDAVPSRLQESRDIALKLGRVYKQINAPVGDLSLDSLKISTRAIRADDAADQTYGRLEGKLAEFTTRRDVLALQIEAILEDAAFRDKPIDGQQAQVLVQRGRDLLLEVRHLASGDDLPDDSASTRAISGT
jgi:hypothetical protein